jgi:hypothetical protein
MARASSSRPYAHPACYAEGGTENGAGSQADDGSERQRNALDETTQVLPRTVVGVELAHGGTDQGTRGQPVCRAEECAAYMPATSEPIDAPHLAPRDGGVSHAADATVDEEHEAVGRLPRQEAEWECAACLRDDAQPGAGGDGERVTGLHDGECIGGLRDGSRGEQHEKERSATEHHGGWDDGLIMKVGMWSDERQCRGAPDRGRYGVRGTWYAVRGTTDHRQRSGATSGWWLRWVAGTAYCVLGPRAGTWYEYGA